MATDEFVLTPVCCRLFLKAILACCRHAEFIQINSPSGDQPDESTALRVSSLDTAGVSILSYDFSPEFFLSKTLSTIGRERAGIRLTLSARSLTRAFRSVSPNKIISVSVRVSAQQLSISFRWKCGIESLRVLTPADVQEIGSVPRLEFPCSSHKLSRISLSFSPRYLSGLIGLIPDSPTLWTLNITSQVDADTIDGQRKIYITNGAAEACNDTGSIVGLTLSQSELNRNGSFFKELDLSPGDSIRIPLSELKAIALIASDEVLKDAFAIQVGFMDFDSFHSGAPILAVHASACNSVVNQAHMHFSVKLWFKGCIGKAILQDEVNWGDVNLDDIDPGEVFQAGIQQNDEEDALLAVMAETLDRAPFMSNSFIAHSTQSTQEQMSVIPEWDSEIPRTPSSAHVADNNTFEDLWC